MPPITRGIQAFGGNMPFLGGRRIASLHGDRYTEWLTEVYGGTGDTDLVGYFFHRAAELMTPSGTMGFIATNSIAEGGNRRTVLARMVVEEPPFVIDVATTSVPWFGTAQVQVSTVHLARDLLAILQERVRRLREKLKSTGTDTVHRRYWWRFANMRRELREHAERVPRFLAIGRVSPHSTVAFVRSSFTPSRQVAVFPLPNATAFAVRSQFMRDRELGMTQAYNVQRSSANVPEPKPGLRRTQAVKGLGMRKVRAVTTGARRNLGT